MRADNVHRSKEARSERKEMPSEHKRASDRREREIQVIIIT